MRRILLAALVMAIAAPAATAEPNAARLAEPTGDVNLTDVYRPLRFSLPDHRELVRSDRDGTSLALPSPATMLERAGRLRLPETEPAFGPSAAPPSKLSSEAIAQPAPPQLGAVNDVNVSQSWYMFTVFSRTGIADPNEASDYMATRYVPSQLAKQLPFDIDAVWMNIDNLYSWSRNWEIQVVLESDATPFTPDLSQSLATTIFDTSTIWPVARDPNDPSQNAEIRNAKVDFAVNGSYPPSAMFAIEDGANSDDFDRADEPLDSGGLWAECDPTTCGLASPTLNVQGNRVVAGGPGSWLGWRFPDQDAGDCDGDGDPSTFAPCARYLHGYIGSNVLHNPDDDVRLSVDFDLTAAGATRAGVFARADRLFEDAGLADYYAIYLSDDRVNPPSLQITANTRDTSNMPVETVLASFPINVPPTGTLTVAIEGYDPVNFTVDVTGNATVQYSESAMLFHGDAPSDFIGWLGDPTTGAIPISIGLGNVFGIIFPNAGGGEALDNFRTERHKDLFVVAKLPVETTAHTTPQPIRVLYDAADESREFFNTFFTRDGTGWTQALFGLADDCQKFGWNLHLGLQVTDPGPTGNSLFQWNSTMASLHLSSCTSPTLSYTCGQSQGWRDNCFGPFADPLSTWVRDTQPDFQVGEPIEMLTRVLYDRAPDNDGFASVFWLACTHTGSGADCVTECNGSGANCGGVIVPLDAANPFRGLNYLSTADDNGDGTPDGTAALWPRTDPASTFIPVVEGGHTVFVFESYFDATPAPISPNPDEFMTNRFIHRQFNAVSGCAVMPYNLDVNSLLMVPSDTTSLFCADPAAHCAIWTPLMSQSDPWNLAEIVGRPALIGDRTTVATPPDYREPFDPLFLIIQSKGAPPHTIEFSPTLVGNGVAFYSVYMADCFGDSIADQP